MGCGTARIFQSKSGKLHTCFISLLGHGGTPLLRQMGFDPLQIGTRYHQHLSAIFAQARAEGAVADIDPNILTRQALLRLLGNPAA